MFKALTLFMTISALHTNNFCECFLSQIILTTNIPIYDEIAQLKYSPNLIKPPLLYTKFSTLVFTTNCTLNLQKLHLSQMPDSHFLSSSDSPEIRFHSCIMCVANPQQSSFISVRSTVLILNNLTVLLHPPGHTVQPLIDPSLQSLSRNTAYSMLFVSSSSFSSFSLEESLPFFSSNTLEHLHISNTHFSNISLSPSAFPQNEKHTASCSACTMLAELSMFECVENALHGSLFESICRKGGFAFLNCSFHKCNRQRELITERTDTSSSNVSLFSDVDFVMTRTHQGSGGAIFHSANNSLIIERCSFKHCSSSSSGGAIYSAIKQTINLISTNFSFCESGYYGGCCIIYNEDSLIIDSCLFENSSDVMGGGAINHHTSNEGDIIDQCLFQNCRCNGTDQGGGGIDIGSSCKTIVKNCVFSNLVSAILGGGITIHTHPSHESTCQLLFCLFRNNTSESDEGHDIHVANNVTSLFNETSLETCRTFTNKERRVVVADVVCDGWLRHMNYPIYVSSARGSGEGMCGWAERKCKTIAIALEMPLWGIGAEDEPIVQLESESLSECPLVVERIKVLVKGVSNELTIISKDITASPLPLQQPLISVAGGELRWTTSSFVHDSSISSECPLAQITSSGVFVLEECIIAPGGAQSAASARFESPLILVASAGKLNLLSTKIVGFSLADAAAISVEGGSTVCANATFSEIVRSSGSGAAIHGSLQSACTLDLDNTSLANCGCSSNDGGGIWASLGEGSFMEIGKSSLALFSQCTVSKEGPACRGGGSYVTVSGEDAKFKFQHVDFQSCDGWKGRNMFVSAPRLSTVISRDSIAFGTDSMEDDDLMGYEDGFGTDPVPLKAFLIEFGGKGYVGGEKSRDFRGCGSKEYPCCSVQYTGLLLFENTKRIIVLNSGFVWNDAAEMTGPAWDIGCTAQEKIRVGASRAANAEAMIAAKANTDITNVMFAVPGRLSPSDSSSNAVLIQGLNGTLKLSLCGIQMDQQTEAVSYGLICMKGGSLECIQFNAAGLRMSGVSLFVIENTCASARLDKLSLTNTTTTAETGLIEAKAGSSIELRNSTLAWQDGALCCHFVKMSDSGAVDASRSAVVQLANNTASNMKLERSGGCVVEGVVKRGSTLIVVGGVFENCTSIDGNGGGMSVKLESGSSMQLGDAECAVELRKCEAQERDAEGSGNGGGIFIEMIGNAEDILLESALFSNCVAARGNNVFVVAADLSRLITPERVKMAVNLRDIRGLSGFERSTTNEQYAIPLVVYLWDNFSGCGFADEESGGDFSACGFEQTPCKTLDYEILLRRTKQFSSTSSLPLFSLCVSSRSYLNAAVALHELNPSSSASALPFPHTWHLNFLNGNASSGSEFSLIGSAGDSAVAVNNSLGGEENAAITSSIELTVRNLQIILPIVQTGSRACIISSSKMLHIDKCTFSTGEEHRLGCFLLEIVKGSFDGKDVVFGSSSSAVDLTCKESAVMISPLSATSFINCTFRSVRHADGNSSCISVKEGEEDGEEEGETAIEIEDCTFDGCSVCAGSGVGGGIMTAKGNRQRLWITNTSLWRCSVPSDSASGRGLGGGLFVSCWGASSFRLATVSFSECNAWRGKNMFVSSDNLSERVTRESMNIVIDVEIEEAPDFDEFCGYENEVTSTAVPLVLFLRDPPQPVLIGGDSAEECRVCGYIDFPCPSIPYAVANRFKEGKAILRLLESFAFRDHLALKTQEMFIDTAEERHKIAVNSGGSGEGIGLIETGNAITFNNITFLLPPSLSMREVLLLCSSSTCIVNGCSAEMKEAGQQPLFGLFAVEGGKLVVMDFEVCNMLFGSEYLISVRSIGRSSEAQLSNVHWEGVQKSGTRGLIEVGPGCILKVEKSGFGNAEEVSCCMIEANGKADVTILDTLFNGVTRGTGKGAAFSGNFDEDGSATFRNNTFDRCKCAAELTGGAIYANVESRGQLIFDNNSVSSCEVPTVEGLGGGLYVKLGAMDTHYSMMNDNFGQNKAYLGRDVFMVCPSPRNMIDIAHWEGSAVEGQDSSTLWTADSDVSAQISETILRFLFPPKTDIVFVMAGGSNESDCGDDLKPCGDLYEGFRKMDESKMFLHINDSGRISKKMERDNAPLTLRGSQAERSILYVESGGCLSQTRGDSSTSMTVTDLIIMLPTSSSVDAVISGSAGKIFITKCAIQLAAGTTNEESACTTMWIAKGCGSSIRFNNVSVPGIVFSGKGGVAVVDGGELIVSHLTALDVSAHGQEHGLIQAVNAKNVKVEYSEVAVCSSSEGPFISITGVHATEISGNCSFRCCSNGAENGEGGFMLCQLDNKECLKMRNTSISECSVDQSSGKGGGLLLSLGNNSNSNFSLESISFAGNSGKYGRDVFVVCKALNESIASSRFVSIAGDRENGKADMAGTDSDLFRGKVVDLDLLLTQYCSSEICVSSEGLDVLGCGKKEMACHTFWRGVQNMERDSLLKVLEIRDETCLADYHNLSTFVLEHEKQESSIAELARVIVMDGVEANSRKCVLLNELSLTIRRIEFVIPPIISDDINALLLSEAPAEIITMDACSFSTASAESVGYHVLETRSGKSEIVNTTIINMAFAVSPFNLLADTYFEGGLYENVSSSKCSAGGVQMVVLDALDEFVMTNTTGRNCSCSTASGRGGFLYLDCNESASSTPFSLHGVDFSENNANVGKNMFLVSSDLNATVTNASFDFLWGPSSADGELYVGKDMVFDECDLFKFLVDYRSSTIHISDKGHDFARCGSSEEPCLSLWQGIAHCAGEVVSKALIIEGSAEVNDSYNMTNYAFSSGTDDTEEQEYSSLIFDKKSSREGETFIENSGELKFGLIKFVLTEDFDNEIKAVINHAKGRLELSNCLLQSRKENGNHRQGFVAAKQGSVKVHSLSIESVNMIYSVFTITSGCECVLKSLQMHSCSIESGSVLMEIEESASQNEEKETHISLDESYFALCVAHQNGPSIICCRGRSTTTLAINSSCFDGCKALSSEKGGAVFFELNERGSLEMKQSNVSQCGCSPETGKGGGIYVKSQLFGELNFIFDKCKFSGNSGWKGRDIFVECIEISKQVNDTQFKMDLRENEYNRSNAIFGIDIANEAPIDLFDFISTLLQSTIFVSSSASRGGNNGRQCGTFSRPCKSVNYGLGHLVADYECRLLVDLESVVDGMMELSDMILKSLAQSIARVRIEIGTARQGDPAIRIGGNVIVENIGFIFARSLVSGCDILFLVEDAALSMESCEVCSNKTEGTAHTVPCALRCTAGSIKMAKSAITKIRGIRLIELFNSTMELKEVDIIDAEASKCFFALDSSDIVLKDATLRDLRIDDGSVFCSSSSTLGNILSMGISVFQNITRPSFGASLAELENEKTKISMVNCSVYECTIDDVTGSSIEVRSSKSVEFESCTFAGARDEISHELPKLEGICQWNESMLAFWKCITLIKDTTICNSSRGGVYVSDGAMTIEKGEFTENNPLVSGYPSMRRNVACSGSGTVNVVSLKGGDGVKDNSSLWMLNEGCSFEGIVSERASSFFIPVLESVEIEEAGNEMRLAFAGLLLLPCNLSFKVVSSIGDEEAIETKMFDEDGFVSEKEVEGLIAASTITGAGAEVEVKTAIEYWSSGKCGITSWWILKNITEQRKEYEVQTNLDKKEGSMWPVIVAVMSIILLIVLIASIAVTIRWRKSKRRTEELEEIVNDNIRKDPKAFEMVTMEMSPEEQWRRVAGDVEKKDDERIKKRVYEKSLGHSESSEHLLSESGSTEYILGKDSDNIPDWVLEKVEEEEEEIRKRTPSPSISSTSTTDTSDTESTFVRGRICAQLPHRCLTWWMQWHVLRLMRSSLWI
ncbi:uncharacterized protein MONOS_4007 [Monocercomonoides exilis]|uniref:uncharacterized protein n=1 Tax=Monocercomonoides exilis TaxID=2049356 RepID=UPI003559C418|nr:hypothetical protein MONOS_4007 [Monocercomonoides exilis]